VLHLSESAKPYQYGIMELLTDYPLGNIPADITLKVQLLPEAALTVSFDGFEASICGREKIHIYLGFMLLLQKLNSTSGTDPFVLKRDIYFDSFGVMLDCSRNAVLTVASIRKYIRFLACTGMNVLMLYTEDTYEVENYPYFGAYRGRFTKTELKECDDYAAMFGIEIIPCIQTLAHLRCALRWNAMSKLRDTEDILYVEAPEVVDFLQSLISSACEPFRSKRIHLGMDEAHYLGLGRYLHENGFKNREELMMTHLGRVQSICDELQLESIMWSDMFFRINSPSGDYYDMPDGLDLSHVTLPSEKLHLTYWDYYHEETSFYEKYLRLHRQMDPDCWFAGGGWTWNGLVPNYTKAFAVTKAGISACKNVQVKNALCTMWQDAGAETPHFSGLPAVLYFAELGYSQSLTMEDFQERLYFLTKIPYDAYQLIDRLDSHPDRAVNNLEAANPSKYCLYQDPLVALFDEQIKEFQLGSYYKALAGELKLHTSKDRLLVNYYHTLAEVLSIKAPLGNKLHLAYHTKDRNTLEEIITQDIPACISLLGMLKDYREELWFSENKPFGFEVIDLRFGGIMTRLASAGKRIKQYLEGKITVIEELEEPRLLFSPSSEKELPACNFWEKIVTAGNAAGV
jgi:hexosaminidase